MARRLPKSSSDVTQGFTWVRSRATRPDAGKHGAARSKSSEHQHEEEAQPIFCKIKKQFKICKSNKQSIDCMSDYPIRTEQQLSLVLKSFRHARGMTQADLARALGVTQQTASDLERNAATASVSRLLRMLSALGVELVLRDKQAASDTATQRTPADW